jgi:phage/plasmid-associated DNA primase
MTIRTYFLPKDDVAKAESVMHLVIEEVAAMIRSNRKIRIRVDESVSKRSLEQNDMLHAICGEISKQRQWAGKERDVEAWKRLLVDAWSRTEGGMQCEVVPSLDGSSVVMLGIQTRNMKVGQMAELLTFAHAWCWENDVELLK